LFGVPVWLALSATVLAQTSPDAEKAAQPVVAPSTSSAATTERQTQPPLKPQPGFKPSEEIRADSAVSFPVDI
jgi:hypothetical protein